jgi:RimJ/RimL family protein N-acetyltransferase
MCVYKLATPNDDNIRTIFNWEESEKDFNNISGKTITKRWTYEEYYQKMKEMLEDLRRPYRVLINQSNEILGTIKGYNYLERNNSIIIGFYIPEFNRRKGYGTKIVNLFIDDLFSNTNFKLNKIIATTVETNEGSKRVLEKNSFVLEGKLRESLCFDGKKYTEYYYSILRSEWKHEE